MLPSGNDAALALAKFCGDRLGEGGVATFVEHMNNTAAKLDMPNSRFTNPHGLSDPNNRSTAMEI
jgi:D-alanyl-D-alanine carboxypeptidase (penicillin-binding protein 5/6)